jgi:hypothetical protein
VKLRRSTTPREKPHCVKPIHAHRVRAEMLRRIGLEDLLHPVVTEHKIR